MSVFSGFSDHSEDVTIVPAIRRAYWLRHRASYGETVKLCVETARVSDGHSVTVEVMAGADAVKDLGEVGDISGNRLSTEFALEFDAGSPGDDGASSENQTELYFIARIDALGLSIRSNSLFVDSGD